MPSLTVCCVKTVEHRSVEHHDTRPAPLTSHDTTGASSNATLKYDWAVISGGAPSYKCVQRKLFPL